MKPQLPEDFYKWVFDNMSDGLAYCQMIFDGQGNSVDWIRLKVNKNFEVLTGLKGVTGKKITELIPGIRISNPEMFEIFGRVSLNGKPEKFETYIEPLSRWFLISVYSQEKGFFLSIFQNITDRKQREKDLENSVIAARNVYEDLRADKEDLARAKAKDDAILMSIGDGLVVVDKAGKILLVNKAFENLVGWKMEEVLGRLLVEVIPREDETGNVIPFNERLLTQVLAGEPTTTTTTTTTTYYYVRKDGTRFPVLDTITPIIFDGEIVSAVGVFHDVTKEKEIEKAKAEFISIASHQLRTPVSGLGWLTEALQFSSENLSEKQKGYVKDLSTLSKRLIVLVEDLLNISRTDLKTELMTQKNQVDLLSFVGEFIKEIELYANSKKHTLIFNKSIVDPLIIEINKKSLYNVLQNLASNAIEYSPENTAVTVNLEKAGSTHSTDSGQAGSPQASDFIKISISNKGPAIPKGDQSRIFERFYRAEQAKKIKPEGTGLGLYVVKKIIEDMGGKVGFESEEGKDTTFWFTIPLKKTGN